MANTLVTPTIFAAEAVRILENVLRFPGLVYRGYEAEFEKKINGYEVGSTINIRRPTDFTVRSGRTASIQDVTEGFFTLTVDQQQGIDFKLSSSELTLNIGELSERTIRPAMIQLGNKIDSDIAILYRDVWNWVGTPGEVVNSFSDFAKAPERLALTAVPDGDRAAVLSPSDEFAMMGTQTGLYISDVAREAYRRGQLGPVAGIETYASQNVQSLAIGTRNQTATVVGSQSTTYAATMNTATMTLGTGGWTQSSTILQGEVFAISGVFAVNPVTKATLPFLQQFVVRASATANAITQTTTLTISPPIITTGAFQTVSAAPANSATVTILGTASLNYAQNLVFHRNAFAAVVVPMIVPPGSVGTVRQSYKGISVRVIPYYTGSADESNWRLDVLYGVKTVDARLATRLSGSP